MIRRFLILVLLSVAFSRSDGKNEKKQKIAILGAGIAGLSAAKAFTEHGYEDIEVFEAGLEAGGRIQSIPYKDGFLQMAAQFINGEQNPIYKIAHKLGLITGEVSDLGNFDDTHYFAGNCSYSDKDMKAFKAFIEPLDNKYRTLADTDETASRKHTMFSIYDIDYQKFLADYKATPQQRNFFDAMTRSFRTYYEFEWASRWEDQSMRNLAEWNDLGAIGVSYTTSKIGYKGIIDYIKNETPKDKFRFNSRVTKIRYDKDGVYLSIGGKELDTRFDHVVVTAALGHLKAFHRHLFEPALPRHRQHVIETIGFGGSCKIFFVYERPFWPKEYRAISPLPIKDCNRKGQVNSIESELTTFEVVDWAPNVLTAWIAGHGPTKMDDLTDQQLSNHVTTLFRDMFINASIPAPQNIIRRLWHKNDLFNGSYSYVSKEQAAQNIHHWELSIPVKVNKVPRILFAGEATHHRIFQTAVGAYMSGIREVERLNYFYST
uniref:Amino_oxidase domain-containing protein n=1 Tax=Rhabditophanes sp. KR3021 TaxID=114890 RepID=A0AC35UDW7_9BILA